MKDACTDHNRAMMELWLITRAQKIDTRPPAHPDEHHGRQGKPGPRANQADDWIEAISLPDCRATDRYLSRALKELEKWDADGYAVLHRVYLGSEADEALPERWRVALGAEHHKRDRGEHFSWSKIHTRTMRLRLLEDGFRLVLFRAHRDRMLFIWPEPQRARGMVKTAEAKRREARYFYIRERESGASTTDAVRTAYLGAKCSERAVWQWAMQEGWESMVRADTAPEPHPAAARR